MKPIEIGCLVMLVKAARWCQQDIGKVYTVTGKEDFFMGCSFCGNVPRWTFAEGGLCCGCCLIRIDDDPDAITEPAEQEEGCSV